MVRFVVVFFCCFFFVFFYLTRYSLTSFRWCLRAIYATGTAFQISTSPSLHNQTCIVCAHFVTISISDKKIRMANEKKSQTKNNPTTTSLKIKLLLLELVACAIFIFICRHLFLSPVVNISP